MVGTKYHSSSESSPRQASNPCPSGPKNEPILGFAPAPPGYGKPVPILGTVGAGGVISPPPLTSDFMKRLREIEHAHSIDDESGEHLILRDLLHWWLDNHFGTDTSPEAILRLMEYPAEEGREKFAKALSALLGEMQQWHKTPRKKAATRTNVRSAASTTARASAKPLQATAKVVVMCDRIDQVAETVAALRLNSAAEAVEELRGIGRELRNVAAQGGGNQTDIDKAAQRTLPVMNNLRELLNSKVGAVIISAAMAGFLSMTGIPGAVVYMVTLAAWNTNDPAFRKAISSALASLSRKT